MGRCGGAQAAPWRIQGPDRARLFVPKGWVLTATPREGSGLVGRRTWRRALPDGVRPSAAAHRVPRSSGRRVSAPMAPTEPLTSSRPASSITSCQPRLTSCSSYKLRATSCELKVASYKLRVTSYKLRVASCELRVASCELRVASCELRVTSYSSQVDVARAERVSRPSRRAARART